MAHHFEFIPEAFLPPKQQLLEVPAKLLTCAEQRPLPDAIWLDSTPSTHQLLKTPEYAALEPLRAVATHEQSAGRGQRGNSWEAEPGKNLTFSLIYRPHSIPPHMQFAISEAMALAIVALLREEGIDAKVKWPNDIYVGDGKICGILIEHALEGACITRSILSAGINVNQTIFHSDAPNPVSMKGVLNCSDFDPERLLTKLMSILRLYLSTAEEAEGRRRLHAAFMQNLYRGDGHPYPFYDHLRQERISASITDISPDGTLTLTPVGAPPRRYLFKEVSFLLP